MRSIFLTTSILALTLSLVGCGKKEEPAPAAAASAAPTAANTNVKRGDVEPVGCRGMKTDVDCKKCCDPQYWVASFKGGQCACVKK